MQSFGWAATLPRRAGVESGVASKIYVNVRIISYIMYIIVYVIVMGKYTAISCIAKV